MGSFRGLDLCVGVVPCAHERVCEDEQHPLYGYGALDCIGYVVLGCVAVSSERLRVCVDYLGDWVGALQANLVMIRVVMNMGLFGTVKERIKERVQEMNPATRIESRIKEKKEYEDSLKTKMADKEEAYRNRSLNKEADKRLKEKYERKESSFVDRLGKAFGGVEGAFGESGKGGGGFANSFEKMGFGGSSTGRRSRNDSGALGGDALRVLGVGGSSSRYSRPSRATTVLVHVGGSGKKKRKRRRDSEGYGNPMAGIGF